MTTLSKAVVPAAGLGTRFLPATKAQPKEMLPVFDKPAIQYIIEEAVRASLKDILVITGRGKRAIEDHFDRSYELEQHLERLGRFGEAARLRAISEMARLHYVRQPVPNGLGAALLCAQDHVGSEPFAVLLADDIIDPNCDVLGRLLEVHSLKGGFVLCLKEVKEEEVSRYGIAAVKEIEPDLVAVTDVVEKPARANAPSRLAVIGRYVFEPSIFDYIKAVKPDVNGEIQLTDAIRAAIGEVPVHAVVTNAERYDAGNKIDFLRANIVFALSDPTVAHEVRLMLEALLKEHRP